LSRHLLPCPVDDSLPENVPLLKLLNFIIGKQKVDPSGYSMAFFVRVTFFRLDCHSVVF